jgi:hypothetical protein
MIRFRVHSVAVCCCALMAGEMPAAESVSYETHVAPILEAHCVRCHNSQSMKAELDLSTPRGLFRGGESGPIVELGKAKESLLFEMIHEDLMPPEDDRERALRADEIDTIQRWLAAGSPFASGVDPKQLLAAAEINNHQIEPLLRLRCSVCHGARVQQGELDVRSKASLLKGGKSGPAIVLGKPEESLLLRRIHRGEMPPKELLVRSGVRPMTTSEIENLSQWIALGAPEDDVAPDVATSVPDPLVNDEDRSHWAFRAPLAVSVPHERSDRVRTAIDSFVLRRLREQGLEFSPDADKLTLLRRATFDLTGLPPEPEEVERFLRDNNSRAYERLIERLLASPRYGERWGQFWLDAAGYSDSEGKRSADPIRAYAYRYRDYVIRSLNDDKPYDRFLLEQIAGDELEDLDNAERVTSQMVDNLIATGFLRMAPDGTGSDIVNTVTERMEVVADEIDIFSSTVLGLTIKCARCHSHKYDPLPQRDYYRLAAIFKGAMDEHDWLKPVSVPGQTKSTMGARYKELLTPQEEKELVVRRHEIEREIATQKERLADLGDSIRQKHLAATLAKLPSALRADLIEMLATPAAQRSKVQQYLAGKFERQLKLTDKQVKAAAGYKRPALAINRNITQLEKEKSEKPMIRALWDRGAPSPTYIYVRGDFQTPGRLVGPGVPSMLTDGKTPFIAEPPWDGALQTGRRLALAKWLVQSDHPLTARVMVNRLWQHHFGRGIVASVDNFGILGAQPTHPQLLDWLAVRFVNDGWSIKRMHQLLMTSTVYRQSSRRQPEHEQRDFDNRWLSRMPTRRVDAEEVRDSLLSVAGELDQRPFGRPDAVDVRGDGLVTSIGTKSSWRRSIYVRHRRCEMPSVLETFDLPQMNPACQERPSSTVAQQPLYLMNNTAVRDLSRRFAERVLKVSPARSEQIEQIYLTALSRPPGDAEREAGHAALSQLEEQWRTHFESQDESPEEAPLQALTVFCHTIMNTAEFIYVD